MTPEPTLIDALTPDILCDGYFDRRLENFHVGVDLDASSSYFASPRRYDRSPVTVPQQHTPVARLMKSGPIFFLTSVDGLSNRRKSTLMPPDSKAFEFEIGKGLKQTQVHHSCTSNLPTSNLINQTSSL